MTLLEFCEGYFPNEALFYEMEGLLTVNLQRLFGLEYDNPVVQNRVKPTDIICALAPWADMYSSPGWAGPEELFLSEEETQLMKRLQIVIDPKVAGIKFDNVRRPYFRMRGRPVTEEQAFDIIRRTDAFFLDLRHDSVMSKYELDGLVGEVYTPDLRNDWFGCRFICTQGWVRPDGVVGINSNCSKYPAESELVQPLLPIWIAFPYLDMMMAITDWNESPHYAHAGGGLPNYNEIHRREDYPDFEEHIVYGIWLHDGTLELMAPARAREKYAEYRRLYSGPDEGIFTSFYYEDNHIHPADFEYLKRCIRSHGLDPAEVLANYVWDPVKGLQKRSFVL